MDSLSVKQVTGLSTGYITGQVAEPRLYWSLSPQGLTLAGKLTVQITLNMIEAKLKMCRLTSKNSSSLIFLKANNKLVT